MNKSFEKILERLDEPKFNICRGCTHKEKCNEVQEKINNKEADFCAETMRTIAKEIVQEVAEEYSYLSKGFNNGLLKRIADYFSSVYEGDDKTAPKMELSVYDLRYIASLNVEKCRLQTEINNIKKSHEKYNNGWIPCSERLPGNIFTVIIQVKEMKKPTFGWYENITGWILTEQDLELKDFTVIAWQPLPEPYKESE